MTQENILSMQIIPYFLPTTKNTIVLQLYILKNTDSIRWEGSIAYNNENKAMNPLVAGIYFKKAPTPDKAWTDLKKAFDDLNNARKQKSMPKYSMDESNVRMTLNANLSSVITQFDELKQKSKQENSSQYSDFEGVEYDDAPQPEHPSDRTIDFIPYSSERKNQDGDIIENVDLCNFNVRFKCILKVGDVLRTRCNINYKENGTGTEKIIEDVEVDKAVFHDKMLFTKFFPAYSDKLWCDKRFTNELLTAINKDETLQKPTVVNKTQDFGWNKNFSAFLTPEYDFELELDHNGNFEKDYNDKFILKNHFKEYCDKHNIDWEHIDPDHPLPKIEGSVKILNEKIKENIKLGFKQDIDPKPVLMHIKNIFMKMGSIIDRTIPIVFLAPLTSVLQELDLSYQMYLQGKSGYGKSQISILYMNFFASVDNKDQLINILRDKIGAIEEVGFYSKDVLFTIDNFKESAIDKKEFPKIIAMLQSIADRQGTRRMTKSDFGSYRVRGTTLISGEEMLQDSSTIRKYDLVHIDEKINIELLKECHLWKNKYSGVMYDYVQWLMRSYGNNIRTEIERRNIKHGKEFINPIFTLNMLGYELFLEYLIFNDVISIQEFNDMYKNHLKILKSEEGKKEELVESKSTAQKLVHAIQSGLTSRKFRILNDPEYGDAKINQVIGQCDRECTNIIFYGETYFLLKQIDDGLPDDLDSLWENIKDNNYVHKQVVHRCDNQQKARLIVFNREYIVPHTSISGIASLEDIASEVEGSIEYQFKLTEPPTKEQYNEIVTHILKLLPSNKKSDKEEFEKTARVLINTHLKGKFGSSWESPNV